MYQYKITDEVSSNANGVLKTRNKEVEDFINDLKNINTKLTSAGEVKMPEAPNFTKMEDVVIDNSKIEEDAIKSLESYKNSSMENINKEFDNKSTELNANKKNLILSASDMKNTVKKDYEKVKESAEADAIKRGLARSSIVINTLDAFNKDELETYKAIDKELTDGLNAINFELNALVSAKDDALRDFDIEYASELTNKINETTDKLKEAQEKVIKYNNDIAEKEANYLKSISELEKEINDSNWDRDKDVAELIAEYGITVVDRVRNNQLLNTAKTYFASLSKKEAAEVITAHPEIVSLLGDANYREIMKMYE